ncbi:MAG: hypothetical protein FOGNACKC_06182 [Anaerolineae bacterium]|nr:hypothetical protein [Anaerolineae bacterium]
MIKCNLDQLLDKKISCRAHARKAGLDWPALSRLLHNQVGRVNLATLRKLQLYLHLPGETRWRLGDILTDRGISRQQLAAGTGKQNYVTFSRMANNTLLRADFAVMESLCEFLELDSLEQLLDTGGLLVWERNN